MRKNEFLPVILGSDENAYGNARLFAEAYGIRPLVVCKHRLIPTMDSRLFDMITVEGFDRGEIFERELRAILTEKKKEYGAIIVIPCSDYYVHLLSAHPGAWEGLIANRFISLSLLRELDRKDRFYALCERFGMDYPKTLTVSPEEREEAPERLGFDFPIVLKPENSNASDYLSCCFEGKKKVFFLHSREEYRRVIGAMESSGYRGKLLLQEFVPGGDDAMRVVNTYSDSEGKTRMVCLGQPVLEEYAPATIGNYAAVISRSDEALCRRIATFLDSIGYVGFANFDMKYDARSGRYLLFEINCRPGRSSFYVRGAGCNMMKLMTEDVVFGVRGKALLCPDREALWTAVPRGVLMKYVKSPALREEIRRLWREGRVSRTLFCPGDLSLRRRLAINRYFYSYYKSYSRYYFDKDEQKGAP